MAEKMKVKKVSTVGVADPVVRRVLEELAARIVALEKALSQREG